MISSSYTLKPVYRRAAANKASDKIAKEASKATKNSDEDLSELSSDCDGDKDQKHQTTKQPNHRINSRYGHHLHFFHFFLVILCLCVIDWSVRANPKLGRYYQFRMIFV